MANLKASREVEVRNPEDEELDELYSEWENLSQEEKDKKVQQLSVSNDDSDPDFNPGLNLDGAFDSSDDDEPIASRNKKKSFALESSDEDDSKQPSPVRETNVKKKAKICIDSDSDINISDIELDSLPDPVEITKKPVVQPVSSSSEPKPGSSKQDIVNRIVPPREPAVRGNRPRPTLIVCPTSLLSHWCQEIDRHVDDTVDIKIKIHHGTQKAKLGADLNTYDIVITTYGTLAYEVEADTSPLLRAKWLRVVLDEGHYIKNHRTKAAKAANKLNTKRRWVITGTPIQNNLLEFWSLVNWLQFEMYAGDLVGFKNQIERPCKNREDVGFERLQVLMDAICLRRTKNDKKPNGDPIVPLPKKTILIRDVFFSEDEKLCYDILKAEATEIVMRYQARGQLLKNYAHIFALMMRLRQLCCHRELIKEIDWSKTIRDKSQLEQELGHLITAEGGGPAGDLNDEEKAKVLVKQLRRMIKDGVTEDCSICLDDLKSPVITPCAHVFCRPCIERVLEVVKPPNCPLCRGGVAKKELLEAGQDEEVDSEEIHDPTLKALEDIKVDVGSNKVNAALKEMIRIRAADPSDKIVVVSQFTSFLSIIQPILADNGFKFVRLDGTMSLLDRADVVTLFQKKTPNSPTVLLLSLKAGGVGLNLTSANHLLLLDPAWNPAAEWQCFDRIHRMGQDKNVFIYKYITKVNL